jgi:hypothetical protein
MLLRPKFELRNFDREDRLVAGHFLLTGDRREVDRTVAGVR